MKYGKKIRQHMGASKIFSETDWVQYKELKVMIKNEAQPEEFKATLAQMIKHSEEIFVATLEEEDKALANSFIMDRKDELRTFANANRESCRKIVKKYKKKLGQSIDIQTELDATSFRFYAQSPCLSVDAKPFSPSLNANAPEFSLSSESPEFKLSADTPAWTPTLNADAPAWTPSLNTFAQEFIPMASSKPATKNLSFGITESSMNFDTALDLDLSLHPLQMQQSETREIHPLQQTTAREAHPLQQTTAREAHPLQAPPALVEPCNVEARTYSVDWLLSKRTDPKLSSGPVPDIPSGISFPVHSREALWSDTFYEGGVEDDCFFDVGTLSQFVTPTFFDEVAMEDRNDPVHRVYGCNFLQSVQPYFCDVHPDLLERPELLCSTTMNNMVCQFMASGLMTPFLQQTFGAVPDNFVGMPGLGPNMNPMLQMQNMLSAMMNMNGTQGQFPAHASDSDTAEKEASSPPRAPSPKKKRKEGKRTPRSPPSSTRSSTSDRKISALDEPLHKASQPWSRRAVVVQEEDLAARTMQSILNKLVPEKFDRLLAQAMSKIDVSKKSTLVSLATCLHKKAISEADYAPIYTHFVRKLRNSEFKSFNDNGEIVNIETSLLELCLARLNEQPEFDETDEEVEFRKRVYWKETLGNYTLLGELYKREVISHEHVVGIMRMLVAIVGNAECDIQERSKRLEEMFHLLKSCGAEFEEKCKQLNYMASDLSQITKIGPHFLETQFEVLLGLVGTSNSDDTDLPPRVRFMLRDLIDLKNKHWEITNKNGMDPKFLGEIREEIRKEKVQKQHHLHSLRRITRKESSKRRTKMKESPRTRVRRRMGQQSKSDGDLVRLGQARRPKIHKIQWTKIVQGCLTDPDPKSRPVNAPPSQTFINVAKGPKNSWAAGPPKNLVKELVKDSDEDVSSLHSSVPSDLTTPTSGSSTASINADQRTREMDTMLIETNLLEFFETNEMEKCVACFGEVLSQGASAKQLLETLMNIVIERCERNREQFALLLVRLAEDTLSAEQFREGFEGVDEFLDDWRLDVPLLPSYLAGWLERLTDSAFLELDSMNMRSKSWQSMLQIARPAQTTIQETCI